MVQQTTQFRNKWLLEKKSTTDGRQLLVNDQPQLFNNDVLLFSSLIKVEAVIANVRANIAQQQSNAIETLKVYLLLHFWIKMKFCFPEFVYFWLWAMETATVPVEIRQEILHNWIELSPSAGSSFRPDERCCRNEQLFLRTYYSPLKTGERKRYHWSSERVCSEMPEDRWWLGDLRSKGTDRMFWIEFQESDENETRIKFRNYSLSLNSSISFKGEPFPNWIHLNSKN